LNRWLVFYFVKMVHYLKTDQRHNRAGGSAMAATHRSRGERAPIVGSLRGLTYNEAGATWILTSEFAENGAVSKRACDGRAFTPKLGNGGCSRWWSASIEVRKNGRETTSSSLHWCWFNLGGVSTVRQWKGAKARVCVMKP
jgi:hypothetical protein